MRLSVLGQPHGFWVLGDGWKDPGCADRVALTESWSSHLTACPPMARTRLISLSGSASQAGGYPVDHVTVSACKTRGHRVFHVVVDDGGTGARRICVACAQSAYVADSGEYWMDEEAEPVSCECGGSTFEFVASFSLHPGG